MNYVNGVANLNISAKPAAKTSSSQPETNFLQIASTFFQTQSASQVQIVPQSFNEEQINLFKDKQEIEQGTESLEDLLKEKVDGLMAKICKILSSRYDK